MYEILPKSILNNLEKILNGEVSFLDESIREEYISKFKYIPFTSIGRTNGMLLGLKVDKIIIYFDEREIKKENIIVGIYDKSFTKYGEYMAIFGDNILNEED
ncbi:Sporulation factor SpoIIGA [compost metagenome]